LRQAAKLARVVLKQRDRVLEDIGDTAHAGRPLIHESAMNAIALGAPEMFRRKSARRSGHVGINRAVKVQTPHQTAVQRSDRDGVTKAGAAVGNAQFQRRVLARGPDRPPDEAGVLDGAGRHHDVEIAPAIAEIPCLSPPSAASASPKSCSGGVATSSWHCSISRWTSIG
jgi:hypothetical protein